MTALDLFRAHGVYNRWMNQKLLDECSKLSDAARKAPVSAPFGSLHGVWNHLFLADRLWLQRFRGQPTTAKRLDEEVFANWDELCQARAKLDDQIEAFILALTPEQTDANLEWTMLSLPGRFSLPLGLVLSHFFNHQTHHRGQITALLEQHGGDCGVTDFLRTPGLPLVALDDKTF